MRKMAKPKSPEMSSSLQQEEGECRNSLTHKLNFKSGDLIPTLKFWIINLLFEIFVLSWNRWAEGVKLYGERIGKTNNQVVYYTASEEDETEDEEEEYEERKLVTRRSKRICLTSGMHGW